MESPFVQSGCRKLDPSRIEVVDRATAAIMRRMSGGEKLKLACRMGDAIRQSIRYQLRRKHPEWTEARICGELARRAGNAGAI